MNTQSSDNIGQLTREELPAMRERCDKATPGPWGRNLYLGGANAIDRLNAYGEPVAHIADVYLRTGDADFIAHAREDMPRLLDALEAATANNNRSVCAYCGHVGPKDPLYIVEHMTTCEQHPAKLLMEKLTVALEVAETAEAEVARLRGMVKELARDIVPFPDWGCMLCGEGLGKHEASCLLSRPDIAAVLAEKEGE